MIYAQILVDQIRKNETTFGDAVGFLMAHGISHRKALNLLGSHF